MWEVSCRPLTGRLRQMLTVESAREEGSQRTGEGEQPVEGKPMKKSLWQVLGLLGGRCSVGSPGGLVCQRQRGLSQVAQVQPLPLLRQRWERWPACRRGHFANACSRREQEEGGLRPLGGLSEEGAA